MRVLVTGGAGFIGSYFVRALLADEYPDLTGVRVTVLDKLTYAGNLSSLSAVAGDSRFRFVHGDICSAADLDAALPGHDLVFNFAAETHVNRSIDAATDLVTTNVLGVQQVFEACLRHDVPTVVHLSTDEVYGSISTGSWTEDQVLAPNSPFAATKAGGDLLARAYAATYGLDVRVTRCSNNYGPYQFPEKVIPVFVTDLLDGLPVPLYGDGANVRDWVYVGDHCRALALVATRGEPGEIYNIGGGHPLTNRALTQLLLDATGRDWTYISQVADPRGDGHDMRYSLDFSKIAALGYQPSMPFAAGLAKTVAWFRDNRAWWGPLRDRP